MTHILIIDDDEQVLKMLCRVFEDKGYQVATASDGRKGIKLYKENRIDLIITDLVMPEMEGIETIRELRKEFGDIKIIAMSGGGIINSEQYLKIAENLGAQYTFPKPVELKKLLKAVKELTE